MLNMNERDQHWMTHALKLAAHAQSQGEVPVGAVLVYENEVIAEGWNQPICCLDPTAHAEIIALRHGAKHKQNYRLLNTTLYVTLEPCAMCAGAIVNARVQRVVFGAFDPRAGAAGSVFSIFAEEQLNHRVDCVGGVLAEDCGLMLKEFFKAKR